jgi:hypothetical protein
VPATLTATELEVVVTFPSGPLAGEISGWKPLRVTAKEKK